jgi:hypothetical protein
VDIFVYHIQNTARKVPFFNKKYKSIFKTFIYAFSRSSKHFNNELMFDTAVYCGVYEKEGDRVGDRGGHGR